MDYIHNASSLPLHSSSVLDGWTDVRVELPKKDGRYQVIINNGGKLHVTMRKFKCSESYFFRGIMIGGWGKHTNGVLFWKPMSDLPAVLKRYENKQVIGYYELISYRKR